MWKLFKRKKKSVKGAPEIVAEDTLVSAAELDKESVPVENGVADESMMNDMTGHEMPETVDDEAVEDELQLEEGNELEMSLETVEEPMSLVNEPENESDEVNTESLAKQDTLDQPLEEEQLPTEEPDAQYSPQSSPRHATTPRDASPRNKPLQQAHKSPVPEPLLDVPILNKLNTSEDILDALDSAIEEENAINEESGNDQDASYMRLEPIAVPHSHSPRKSANSPHTSRQTTPRMSSPLTSARSPRSERPKSNKKTRSTPRKVAKDVSRLSHDDMIKKELLSQKSEQMLAHPMLPLDGESSPMLSSPRSPRRHDSPRSFTSLQSISTRTQSSLRPVKKRGSIASKSLTPASPGSGRAFTSRLSPDISHLQRFSPSSTYHELMHKAYTARQSPGSPQPHEITVTTFAPAARKSSKSGTKKRKKTRKATKKHNSSDDIPTEELIFVSIRNKDYAYPLLPAMTLQKLTDLIRKYHARQVILWQIKDTIVSPGKVSLEYLNVRRGERLRVVQWIDV